MLSLERLEPREAPGSLDDLFGVVNSLAGGFKRLLAPPEPQTDGGLYEPQPTRAPCSPARVLGSLYPCTEVFIWTATFGWDIEMLQPSGPLSVTIQRNALSGGTGSSASSRLDTWVVFPKPGHYEQIGQTAALNSPAAQATFSSQDGVPELSNWTFMITTTVGTSHYYYYFELDSPAGNNYQVARAVASFGDKIDIIMDAVSLYTFAQISNGYTRTALAEAFVYDYSLLTWTGITAIPHNVNAKTTRFAHTTAEGLDADDYLHPITDCMRVEWRVRPQVAGHGETPMTRNWEVCPG